MMTHDDLPPGREAARGFTWMGGAALILIGAYFLAMNATGTALIHNWWALFLLIPAVGAASAALLQYRSMGRRLTPTVASSLTGTLMLLTIAAIFLFDLSWGIFWPVVLIITGVGLVLGRLDQQRHEEGPGTGPV